MFIRAFRLALGIKEEGGETTEVSPASASRPVEKSDIFYTNGNLFTFRNPRAAGITEHDATVYRYLDTSGIERHAIKPKVDGLRESLIRNNLVHRFNIEEIPDNLTPVPEAEVK